MITKFDDFSGVVSVDLDGNIMYFHLKYDESKSPFQVELWLHYGKYENLSVVIPDSKKLGHKEFFLNPKVEKKIVDELIKENFIEETGKQSIAGDEKTKSFSLLV